MLAKRLAALSIIFVFLADQVSKWLILHTDMGLFSEIEVAPFFKLTRVWNHGVSFGIFNRLSTPDIQRILLSILTLAIVFGLIRWLSRTSSLRLGVALGMIIGGAMGNLIDRFHYGAVADFLSFHWKDHYWPAFNVADSCIVIGVGLILLDSLLQKKDHSVSFSEH